MPGDRKRIITNPGGDGELRELSDTLLADGLETPDALERRLRERFPKARVFRGITDRGGWERWYVYREGRWVFSER
ncbi:MAG TPA: hypothetical protein VM305_03210 [Candidatus Limnocylindrales bacterium]|nr:hypothetical protein [Candidatus Limnocylindrales bacterium]